MIGLRMEGELSEMILRGTGVDLIRISKMSNDYVFCEVKNFLFGVNLTDFRFFFAGGIQGRLLEGKIWAYLAYRENEF